MFVFVQVMSVGGLYNIHIDIQSIYFLDILSKSLFFMTYDLLSSSHVFTMYLIHYSFYNPNGYGRKSNEANIIIFKVGLSWYLSVHFSKGVSGK